MSKFDDIDLSLLPAPSVIEVFLNLKCQNAVSTIFADVKDETRIPVVAAKLAEVEKIYGRDEVMNCLIAQLGCAEISLRDMRKEYWGERWHEQV